MNFKELLTLAQMGEPYAVNEITAMYKPLLIKESIIDSIFDEDLYQELTITLLRCICKIKI